MTCRICGAHRQARASDLWCAGPADLCGPHYNRWFRLYEQEGGVTNSDHAYTTALERLKAEHESEQAQVAC